MLFFKCLLRLAHLLTRHRQKSFLQSQFHMRIGQRFLGLAQLASQPCRFIDFITLFHAH